MRALMTWLLLLAHLLAPSIASAQESDSQDRQAVQTRMDEIVRASVFDFFTRANLAVPLVERVVATPQFSDGAGEAAHMSSLDLRVTLVTDHPAEVIRQLRQYLGQTLIREGFALETDPAAEPAAALPALALTFDVKEPSSGGFQAGVAAKWQEILIFAMIAIAFLSAVAFGAFLLYLPFSRRRRLVFVPDAEDSGSSGADASLPPLVGATGQSERVPPLDTMLAREKEKQNFPVWLDQDGVRVADLEAIRKSFEALPFDEAIEMLSCLDESDRNIILSRLNLNPSVRERIRKEVLTRAPVLSP